MLGYVSQLKKIQIAYNNCPILFCGDLFDRWNAPAEMINWCLDNLPYMYGIPGQHDLPYHRYADIEKSAYWTLVKAQKITNLKVGQVLELTEKNVTLHGFPWGVKLKGPDKGWWEHLNPSDKINGKKQWTHIAMIHAYCWTGNNTYPGAKEEDNASEWAKRLKGYHFGLFGDNHKGFIRTSDSEDECPYIINNGTFMRRKADEILYRPRVTILYKNYPPVECYIDCKKDQFTLKEENVKDHIDADELIKELSQMEDAAINFEDTIKRYLDSESVGPAVRQIILRAMEE